MVYNWIWYGSIIKVCGPFVIDCLKLNDRIEHLLRWYGVKAKSVEVNQGKIRWFYVIREWLKTGKVYYWD